MLLSTTGTTETDGANGTIFFVPDVPVVSEVPLIKSADKKLKNASPSLY